MANLMELARSVVARRLGKGGSAPGDDEREKCELDSTGTREPCIWGAEAREVLDVVAVGGSVQNLNEAVRRWLATNRQMSGGESDRPDDLEVAALRQVLEAKMRMTKDLRDMFAERGGHTRPAEHSHTLPGEQF